MEGSKVAVCAVGADTEDTGVGGEGEEDIQARCGGGSCSLVPAVRSLAGCRGHVHRGTAVAIRDYIRV